MVTFSHYGAVNDISGVTSWLQGLITYLSKSGAACALHLHHFGDKPAEGSLYKALSTANVRIDATAFPQDTISAVRETLRFLNDAGTRVFLPQCLPSMFYAARLAARRGVPYALTMHSDDPEYWAIFDACAPRKKDGLIVAVSEEIARLARERRPDCEIRVIPYGVSIEHERARWNAAGFRVIYSGRMVEEQKRISLVLETLIEFCRTTPLGNVVMIGDGPALPALKARVQAADLGERFRFTGRLAPEQVRYELAHAQSLLLMSDYEGLPVAMLEGMTQGLVPVARGIRSGIPQVVRDGETGILVSEDPIAAASHLSKLACDQARWDTLSSAARSLVASSYSQEICFDKWRKVIDHLESLSLPRYPLPVPIHPSLPRFDPRLARLDNRPPTFVMRCKFAVRRATSYPRYCAKRVATKLRK